MGELRLDPLIGLIAAARADLVAVLLSRCDRVFTAAMAWRKSWRRPECNQCGCEIGKVMSRRIYEKRYARFLKD